MRKEFYKKKAEAVARNLLGKILIRDLGNGKILRSRIVETEAYFDEKDPASRARHLRGKLRETMMMEGGTILIYGIHTQWMLNIVTGKKGRAEAVLIRALEPINHEEKLNGPGILTKNLRINKKFDRKNITKNKELWIEEPTNEEKLKDKIIIERTLRIGVTEDLIEKHRYIIKGNKYTSRKGK